MKKVFAVVLILAGYAIGQAIKAPAKASAETSMPQSGDVEGTKSFLARTLVPTFILWILKLDKSGNQ